MNEEQKRIAALQLAATLFAPSLSIEFHSGRFDKMEEYLISGAEAFRPVIDRYLEK